MAAPVLPRVVITGQGEYPATAFPKLDAADQALLAYSAQNEARMGVLEAFVQRQTGNYGFGPITDDGIHVYSAKAAPGWTTLTRKGGFVIGAGLAGSFLDPDGRASVCWLADLPAGAKRYAMVTWNSAGSTQVGNAVTVTVFDVAADGTTTIVRQAQQGYGVFSEGQPPYSYVGAAFIVRINDTMFKVRALYYTSYNYGQSGTNTLYTYTLNTDQGANTLSATNEIDNSYYRNNGQLYYSYSNYSGFFRRKAWLVGAYSVAWPTMFIGSSVDYAARQQPGVFIGDRLPKTNFLEARATTPNPLNSVYTSCMERIGASTFVHLSEGQSIGRTNPAYSAKVSVSAVEDTAGGSLASVSIPYGIAGNSRIAPISATLFAVGFTNGSQFGSYLVTRDANGGLTWRGTQDISGVLGTVWAEANAFSATKIGLWTVSAGWTFNLTTVACDPTATPGLQAAASPFTQVAQAQANLGALIPGAVAGDSVILAATERMGPDRLMTVARNNTHPGLAVEIWDAA